MTTLLGKRSRAVDEESEEHVTKRVRALPCGAAEVEEESSDESNEDESNEDESNEDAEEPTQAFCEEQYYSYRSRVSGCSNQLHAIEMQDEAQHYWDLLERLYPTSRVLRDDDDNESVGDEEADQDQEQDKEVPIPKDEDIHPIYGDISKYNTDDVDTDVE
jgi:hypothetical protein